MRQSVRVLQRSSSSALTTPGAMQAELNDFSQPTLARLAPLIRQASGLVRTAIGREIIRAQVMETVTLDPCDPCPDTIVLSRVPIVEVIAASADGALIDPEGLVLDSETGILSPASFSSTLSLTYQAGYVAADLRDSDMPGEIERACMDTVVALFFRAGRGDPMIRSESVEGIGSTSYLDPGQGAAAALPPTALAALAGLRFVSV